MSDTLSGLPAGPQAIFDHLAEWQQDPQVEGMQDGCYVLSFAHRAYPGRGRVYCAPGGSWTHSASRAAQLARRFPLQGDTYADGTPRRPFYCGECEVTHRRSEDCRA